MNLSKFLLAAVILSVSASSALRAEPSDDKRAHIRAMMKDRETAHMAFEEMLKDKENKRYMAKMLAKDKDFQQYYNTEVGNSGPHEERNPSQHPELFRAKP